MSLLRVELTLDSLGLGLKISISSCTVHILLILFLLTVGRKCGEEGTPVQDPGDRRTRHRQDLHHQEIRPPVLLPALQSYCILIYCTHHKIASQV